MLFIVEGIDRVGKTTFCQALSKKLNIPIFKNKRFGFDFRQDIEIENMNELINFIKCVNADVIIDRFHFSEYVYAKLERGYINTLVFDIDKKMSEEFGDDVYLIQINPTDIDRSSREHGKDLREYQAQFENCFYSSSIKNKYHIDYNQINLLVDFLDLEIRKKGSIKKC